MEHSIHALEKAMGIKAKNGKDIEMLRMHDTYCYITAHKDTIFQFVVIGSLVYGIHPPMLTSADFMEAVAEQMRTDNKPHEISREITCEGQFRVLSVNWRECNVH